MFTFFVYLTKYLVQNSHNAYLIVSVDDDKVSIIENEVINDYDDCSVIYDSYNSYKVGRQQGGYVIDDETDDDDYFTDSDDEPLPSSRQSTHFSREEAGLDTIQEKEYSHGEDNHPQFKLVKKRKLSNDYLTAVF